MINAILSRGQGFERKADTAELYGAIHFTRYQLYGGGDDPPRFWITEDGQGLLSMAGEELTVSGAFSDLEELSVFCAISGANRLRGPKELLAPFKKRLGWQIENRQILWAEKDCPQSPAESIQEGALREVYPVLQQVFGLTKEDFPAWYCETSHKIRHGLGRVLSLVQDGKTVCTAGIYAQNRKAALIGSVATLPAYRGNGFAGALVARLANQARKENRIPFVVCRDPVAIAVYKAVGFSHYGEELLLHRGVKSF